MADNTQLPVPATSGDVIAADEIAGAKYQRIKLIHGAEGVNDGDVSTANPLPVDVGTIPLPADAATETTLAAVGALLAAGIDVDTGLTGLATEASLAVIAAAIKDEDAAASSGEKGISMLGVRRDADTAGAGTDGDYSHLYVDELGRLKVATAPASQAATTGNITANGQTVSIDVSRTSNIMIYCTGTFSTVNCTFEGSIDGGTSWFAVQAVRTNANTIELTTGNLSAAPAYAWELSVNGLTNFRVRATAFTSGTQTWRFQPAVYATEPIPAAQASATQNVNVSSTSGSLPNLPTPATTQGASTHHHAISAASTNATSVKASAGNINDIELSNNGAAVAYFKLYNKASTPTVGTDTPVKTIMIPVGGTVIVNGGPFGIRLATGIAYAITTGMAVADATAVAATQVSVGISYT